MQKRTTVRGGKAHNAKLAPQSTTAKIIPNTIEAAKKSSKISFIYYFIYTKPKTLGVSSANKLLTPDFCGPYKICASYDGFYLTAT